MLVYITSFLIIETNFECVIKKYKQIRGYVNFIII